MDAQNAKPIVEALIYMSDHPVGTAMIRSILGREAKELDIEQLIRDIGEEYNQRKSPIELRLLRRI